MNVSAGFGRSAGRLKQDQKGGPLAEFALVLPFLLLMIFGAFEFGRLLYIQHIITKGVQDAARYAARQNAVIESGSCMPTSGAWSTVVGNAQTIATRGSAGAATLLVKDFTPATVSVSVSCEAANGTMVTSNPAAGTAVPIVVVSAVVPVTDIGFFNFLGQSAVTLRAEHREMAIGL